MHDGGDAKAVRDFFGVIFGAVVDQDDFIHNGEIDFAVGHPKCFFGVIGGHYDGNLFSVDHGLVLVEGERVRKSHRVGAALKWFATALLSYCRAATIVRLEGVFPGAIVLNFSLNSSA